MLAPPFKCVNCGSTEKDLIDGYSNVCMGCGNVLAPNFGILHTAFEDSRITPESSTVYKRVTYFREKLKCWKHDEVAIPYEDWRAIVEAARHWLDTDDGAAYTYAGGLRMLKDEVKTVLVAARVCVKKYLEKWRSVAAAVQPWHELPRRPTQEMCAQLCAAYERVSASWDLTAAQHPDRRNIISVNFIILQLLLTYRQRYYEQYRAEFPLPKNIAKTLQYWRMVSEHIGWMIPVPILRMA